MKACLNRACKASFRRDGYCPALPRARYRPWALGWFCWYPRGRIHRRSPFQAPQPVFSCRPPGDLPAWSWFLSSSLCPLPSSAAQIRRIHQVTKLLPVVPGSGAAGTPKSLPDTGNGQGWRERTGSTTGSRAGRMARLSCASSRGKLSRNILMPDRAPEQTDFDFKTGARNRLSAGEELRVGQARRSGRPHKLVSRKGRTSACRNRPA